MDLRCGNNTSFIILIGYFYVRAPYFTFSLCGQQYIIRSLNISETDGQTNALAIIRPVIDPVYVAFRQQKIHTPKEIDT